MTYTDSQLNIVDKFLSEFKNHTGSTLTLNGQECHELYMILNNIYGEIYENEGTNESKCKYPQNIIDIVVGTDLYDINTIKNLDKNLNEAYNTLEPREKSFIIKRYKEFYTYEDLAQEYNITRERCRQIIQKALRKLRHPSRLRMILGTKDIHEEIEKLNRYARHLEERVECSKRLEKMHDDRIEELKKQEEDISSGFLTKNIEWLGLSVRSYNCLNRGVSWHYYQKTHEWKKEITVEDVINLTIPEIIDLRGLGAKSFEEISNKLYSLGLNFKKVDDEKTYNAR